MRTPRAQGVAATLREGGRRFIKRNRSSRRVDPVSRTRLALLLRGDRAGIVGIGAPKSRVIRFWRGHPEFVFVLCLGFLLFVNFGGAPTDGWVPWTFQELTLQRIPDPVVPFTVGATVVTAVALTWILSPRIGWVRAALIGVSTPVGVVGVFELGFLFIVYPAAFWVPAHLSWAYWDYGFAILSYALFGLVGGGWWRVPRWWWFLLLAVVVGFATWYAAGVPLTVPSIGGRATPANLLGIALVGNVALKWAVFVLLAVPPALGAREAQRGAAAKLARTSPSLSRGGEGIGGPEDAVTAQPGTTPSE